MDVDDNENDNPIDADDVCPSKILEGWTKDEKFRLLQAIKSYGSANIEDITQHVESKTTEEVSDAIDLYRQKAEAACQITSTTDKPSRRKASQKLLSKLQVPLANWARLLTENIGFKDLNNEIATAIRLMAEYEEFPKPLNQNSINFKNLYFLLANAIEGKSLSTNDKVSQYAIEKCLVETALFSKSFIGVGKLNLIHDDMNFAEKDFLNYVQTATGYELANLRWLISQRAYNPLNVSEQHLKPLRQ